MFFGAETAGAWEAMDLLFVRHVEGWGVSHVLLVTATIR